MDMFGYLDQNLLEKYHPRHLVEFIGMYHRDRTICLISAFGDKLWTEVVDGYIARHRVKPGVTGWAQVKGWRGELDSEEKLQSRIEHDLYYIENWSLLFDLYIFLITPFTLLNTKNAY